MEAICYNSANVASFGGKPILDQIAEETIVKIKELSGRLQFEYNFDVIASVAATLTCDFDISIKDNTYVSEAVEKVSTAIIKLFSDVERVVRTSRRLLRDRGYIIDEVDGSKWRLCIQVVEKVFEPANEVAKILRIDPYLHFFMKVWFSPPRIFELDDETKIAISILQTVLCMKEIENFQQHLSGDLARRSSFAKGIYKCLDETIYDKSRLKYRDGVIELDAPDGSDTRRVHCGLDVLDVNLDNNGEKTAEAKVESKHVLSVKPTQFF
jgi:hypothetical protein